MPTIRFTTKLESAPKSGALIPVPKTAKLPANTAPMVEGVINHFPFRAPLGPEGVVISEAIRQAVKAEIGDTVEVELTRVGDEPEVRVPSDLEKALAANPKAIEAWRKITPMARRDWVLSILVVKQAKTREGRLAKTTDMLAHGKGRVCCFPGLNWLTKDHVSKKETWQTLPKDSGSTK